MLDADRPLKRREAYIAVDHECVYQDSIPPRRMSCQRTPAEYVAVVRGILARLTVEQDKLAADPNAIVPIRHLARKLAAISVQAMEDHGVAFLEEEI